MGTVPFLDVAAANARLEAELQEAFDRVRRGPTLILGPEVAAFEEELAAYVGAAWCVAVGNGFDALHLALRGMGVGAGDDVLVPSNTYVATWLAVSATGARPVAVEPLEATHNLDPDRLEAARTERTSAVVPVHLYGQPAEMEAVGAWADAHGLPVLADAAQAHGAAIRGRPVGAFGDAAGWSFYPTKNLGALGDGGAVTTDDPALAHRIRALRSYGAAEPGTNERLGFNSRLDELQAAFLRVKLRHLDAWNRRRAELAARYLGSLAGTGLVLPTVAEGVEPVWHQFVVRAPDRDRLREELLRAGVETMVHYPVPPSRQPAYAAAHGPDDLPIARRLAGEVLSLPIGPSLSDAQQATVIAALRALCPAR